MSNRLEALCCDVDDFCRIFEPQWQQLLLGSGVQQRQNQVFKGMKARGDSGYTFPLKPNSR